MVEYPCRTCGQITFNRLCPEHAAQRRQADSTRLTGRPWRRLRARILARDNFQCQIKGAGCTGHATHVDHIVAAIEGGSDDDSNLRAACEHCNLSRAPFQRARRVPVSAEAPSTPQVVPVRRTPIFG